LKSKFILRYELYLKQKLKANSVKKMFGIKVTFMPMRTSIYFLGEQICSMFFIMDNIYFYKNYHFYSFANLFFLSKKKFNNLLVF
jgi:hypothetical protein